MFSFYKHRKVFIGVSLAIIVIGLILSFTFGINLDIQFRGGSIITYQYVGDLSLQDAEDTAEEALGQNVTAQMTESVVDDRTTLIISVAGNEALLPAEMEALSDALTKSFPDLNVRLVSSDLVAPFIGREMLTNGILAILVSSVLIIIYVWFSFRSISGPSAGVMALIALLHDVTIAFFVFVAMRTPLNETLVAVVLTILGFSINDTIVVYDRIRENVRLTNGSMPLDELVDMSIRQSLTRSINTSVATFSAVAVAFIFATIFGIDSIAEFALPLMVGIIAGAYSSLALASPLWVAWKTRGGRTGYEA
ncbi:MAG TPA: protein translocase subunit SecF [Fastidiosipila sp.]|nr:protein translocase subunit SecF [Fastidiosipila sp.]